MEAITYIDQGNKQKAEELYTAIIDADPDSGSVEDVEAAAEKAVQGLLNIRKQYNLPEKYRP